MINALAQELNAQLESAIAGRMLSGLGKRLFFPKGIIAQSAEAKKFGKKANATIGTAVSGGKPVILPSIAKELPFLSPDEAVGYAPTAGSEELRRLWKKKMEEKNPTLAGKACSLPVVTAGLTSGISCLCDLFLDEGTVLLTADPCWDNYSLIVETRNNAALRQFPLFTERGIDMESLRAAVTEQAKSGQVRILLNFPQNPTGYSPTKEEAAAICALIRETAETGADVMVWVDDAYFGLDYEDNIEKESLFAFLADIHERVLAVKIDGPTKEDYVWGFRTGFLTFGSKGLTEQHYTALNQKLMGAIRSSISCASTPTQSMLIKSWSEPANENEKIGFRHLLEERYRAVCECVSARKGHPALRPLPFNSGYFMTLACTGVNAEELRQKLLHEYGIGTIAIDDAHLRVAYSSVDIGAIPETFDAIYEAAALLYAAAETPNS